MTNLINVEIDLQLVNEQIRVSSRTLAEIFDKDHKYVLKTIRKLLKKCGETTGGNFAPRDFIDIRGKIQPEYLLTERGFLLIAMGFSGEKALKLKEAILDKIDQLSKELNELKTQQNLPMLPKPKREYKYTVAIDVLHYSNGMTSLERKVIRKRQSDMNPIEDHARMMKQNIDKAHGQFRSYLARADFKTKYGDDFQKVLHNLEDLKKQHMPVALSTMYLQATPMFPDFDMIE